MYNFTSSSGLTYSSPSINNGIYSDKIKIITTPMEVETKYMEYLYNVIIVDKKCNILIDKKVVAKTQKAAEFNAGVYDVLKEKGLTPDDVTIFVNTIGSVEVEKVQ